MFCLVIHFFGDPNCSGSESPKGGVSATCAEPQGWTSRRPDFLSLQARRRLRDIVFARALRGQLPPHLCVPATCLNPTRKSRLGRDLSKIAFSAPCKRQCS